ncbi:hypothetical protein ACS15_1533 [Ralstonia insidiosa]|uniref:Uncharacterized protein n=1 Tax=Ralstonia insidiosa TaxID=190721 RepID=A0AAC9FQW1_9RALS|nr:hypothetical protein ACS15_1533 [Ralstonia insidiosa]
MFWYGRHGGLLGSSNGRCVSLDWGYPNFCADSMGTRKCSTRGIFKLRYGFL